MRTATCTPGWLLPCLLLIGCGGQPTSSAERAAHAEAAREPALLQVGDLLLRAGIAPTDALTAPIAARYGVERDPRSVLLLVGLRRVDGADEASVAATVEASVRDLRGVRTPVVLREVRNEGFIDYAAGVRTLPPDTLTFDIVATTEEGTRLELRFNRDVFPPRQ